MVISEIRKICPKCGFVGSDSSVFCGECGTALAIEEVGKKEHIIEQDIFCPSCGTENSFKKEFCKNCGYDLKEFKTIPPTPTGEIRVDSKIDRKTRSKERPVLSCFLGFLEICEGCLSILTCCAACA